MREFTRRCVWRTSRKMAAIAPSTDAVAATSAASSPGVTLTPGEPLAYVSDSLREGARDGCRSGTFFFAS
jgi:hypothetical protein